MRAVFIVLCLVAAALGGPLAELQSYFGKQVDVGVSTTPDTFATDIAGERNDAEVQGIKCIFVLFSPTR